MYQIIERQYTGPERADRSHIDASIIEICQPGQSTNVSPLPLSGWSIKDHGKFDTFEDATDGVAAIFGELRTADPLGQPFASEREHVVAVFKPGKYVQRKCLATSSPTTPTHSSPESSLST